MKLLEKEKSPYLQKAAGQPVNWHPYSGEAFKKARDEDKPVFLSSGAVWCHWCHVQAKDSFEEPGIARLLNENFICIKIDRDERPDIDRRYQEALHAMGESGGWPLSIFLTPEGKPFFGGTYFPPADSYGKPAFIKVLQEVSRFYRENREDAYKYAEQVMKSLKQKPLEKTPISEGILLLAAQDILGEFDAANGGFGYAPKFPMPGAIEFLMGRYFFERNPAVAHVIKLTLTNMAMGGIFDQLGGGFHRYSTDAEWIIPHFEKMGEDNAWLLRNYVEAHALFGEKLYREAAEGIIRFVKETLSDPAGGFYASQDADVDPDDEGGYFTWTIEEMKNALSPEEFRVASMHLTGQKGRMHHDPEKHVLFVAARPEEVAERTGKNPEQVKGLRESAKKKLLQARLGRPAPFVDRTMYSYINGLFVSSYLSAWRLFGGDYLKDFALKSLARLREQNILGGTLYRTPGVKGVLEDHVHVTGAFLDAYEATADRTYIELADSLMEATVTDFWDSASAGFFDTSEEVAGIRLKQIEDIPHPSANAAAAWHMVRLYTALKKDSYLKLAQDLLEGFKNRAERLSTHGGTYFWALEGYFRHMSLTVAGPAQGELSMAALQTFRPHKAVSYSDEEGQWVLPCTMGRCLDAVKEPSALKKLIQNPGA